MRRPTMPTRTTPTSVLLPFAVLATITGSAAAQSLEAFRQQLRDDLGSTNFAQSLLGLVMLSDELELGGATYQIDDGSSTDLKTYSLPFHTTVDVWGQERPRLHVEGTLGWAEARQGAADVYGGQIPSFATAIDSKWTTYGALLGLGLQFQPLPDVTVTPILDVGLSRIENDTRYTGPGAAFTAALTDGIAFNWDAMTLTYGGALRAGWLRPLGERYRLEASGRYDLRWNDSFATDDSAQDFTARTQMATVRGDLYGPAGFDLFDKPVEWQLTSAYRAFLEGDLFGVDGYVQLGASLLIHTGEKGLPGTSGFALGAAVILGDDLTGWTLGCRLLF